MKMSAGSYGNGFALKHTMYQFANLQNNNNKKKKKKKKTTKRLKKQNDFLNDVESRVARLIRHCFSVEIEVSS